MKMISMNRRRWGMAGLALVVVVGALSSLLLLQSHRNSSVVPQQKQTQSTGKLPQTNNSAPAAPTKEPAVAPAPKATESALHDPVAGFLSRVTKKPFGIYITPSNSPVQPEKFTGYHTGADAEYGEVTADVPVYSVASGTVT